MPGCVTAPGSAACACKSQLASLLACQMPLRLGLPPTRAGRAAGACPDVFVIDSEMTAPRAAAPIATVIIERENRPRMISSLLRLLPALLQRIIFNAHEIRGAVACGRVRTLSLRKGGLGHTLTPHQPRRGVVSFDATGLVVNSVVLFALFSELLLDGPG